MNSKAIRIILLLTLLSVAGQLTAFNQHCDMGSEPNNDKTAMTMSMSHSSMDHNSTDHSSVNHNPINHSNHDAEDVPAGETMPCCDMSSGCDMATCVAMMLASTAGQAEVYRQSSLINLYKPNFHSFELHSFYKPPIFS